MTDTDQTIPTPPPNGDPAPEPGGQNPPAESGEDGQRPGSVLTKGLGEDQDKAKEGEEKGREDGEKKEGEDKSLSVPEKPDGYEATFPEGMEVDQELLTAYRSKAHELGLNQKQFQELAAMYAEKTAGDYERFQKAQFDSVDKAGLEWLEELKARPTYEADLQHATRALAQFGSKELYDYFDVSMAGNYPPIFDFVAAVGKALSEPDFKGRGGADVSDKSAATVLYPNQGKK